MKYCDHHRSQHENKRLSYTRINLNNSEDELEVGR